MLVDDVLTLTPSVWKYSAYKGKQYTKPQTMTLRNPASQARNTACRVMRPPGPDAGAAADAPSDRCDSAAPVSPAAPAWNETPCFRPETTPPPAAAAAAAGAPSDRCDSAAPVSPAAAIPARGDLT